MNIFVLSGCARLDFVDKKLGEIFFNASSSINRIESDKRQEKEAIDPKNLTKEHKARIDAWLKEQDLNRYGDLAGTYYASGTPLFDALGKAIERYEYILSNHPDIFK
jgi:hypothetical protein